MSRIASVFAKPNHTAFIPYVTVGYPNIEATLRVVSLLAESGCDLVELGIPFSDPIADGVTIQKSSFHALQNGVTPKVCLEVAQKLNQELKIPLAFMSYFNPILNYGLEEFCAACAKSGIDGLIIPDLPPEEGSALEIITQNRGLDLIYLLAPTSTKERIQLVAQKSRGFIYLVSVTGVTGARDNLPSGLEAFVTRVRKVATQPLCLGFGISTPQQARQISKIVDGVIIGSRIIQLIDEDKSLNLVQDFARQLREALDS
jgi:tryptophan synthase alpha chain